MRPRPSTDLVSISIQIAHGLRSRTNNSLRASGELALQIFRELASFDTEWIELTQNAHQLPRKLLSEKLQLSIGLQERPIRAVLMGHDEPTQKIDGEGDVPRFVAMYEIRGRYSALAPEAGRGWPARVS